MNHSCLTVLSWFFLNFSYTTPSYTTFLFHPCSKIYKLPYLWIIDHQLHCYIFFRSILPWLFSHFDIFFSFQKGRMIHSAFSWSFLSSSCNIVFCIHLFPEIFQLLHHIHQNPPQNHKFFLQSLNHDLFLLNTLIVFLLDHRLPSFPLKSFCNIPYCTFFLFLFSYLKSVLQNHPFLHLSFGQFFSLSFWSQLLPCTVPSTYPNFCFFSFHWWPHHFLNSILHFSFSYISSFAFVVFS